MLYHVLENSKQCRDCARVDMIWFSFGILSGGNGQMFFVVDLSLWQGVAEVQQKVNEVHEENRPIASPCKILVTNELATAGDHSRTLGNRSCRGPSDGTKAWMVRSGEPGEACLGQTPPDDFDVNRHHLSMRFHETCQNVCTPSLSNYVKLISAESQVIDELQKELLAVKKVGSIRDNLAQRHIIDLSDLTDIPQKAPLNDSW